MRAADFWRQDTCFSGICSSFARFAGGKHGALARACPMSATVMSPLSKESWPQRLLRGLDPQCLGDVRELVVLLLDAGGEFGGSAHIDDLSGRRQSRCNGGIGRDHGPDIGGDALAQRIPHTART